MFKNTFFTEYLWAAASVYKITYIGDYGNEEKQFPFTLLLLASFFFECSEVVQNFPHLDYPCRCYQTFLNLSFKRTQVFKILFEVNSFECRVGKMTQLLLLASLRKI